MAAPLAQAALAEFIGTMLLILFGDGVVANFLLENSKGKGVGANWIGITAGWAFAVMVGVAASVKISGGFINPAVAIAFAVIGKLPWEYAAVYIPSEIAGAFVGALLVYVTYRDHYLATKDPVLILATFSTIPNIRDLPMNFVTEVIGTFALVFGVLALISVIPPSDSPWLVPVLVGFLVWGIGLSLGGPTGYAINPARDLGPRIAHAILPIPNKGSSDWRYGAIVPIFGPIVGGIIGAVVWALIFG